MHHKESCRDNQTCVHDSMVQYNNNAGNHLPFTFHCSYTQSLGLTLNKEIPVSKSNNCDTLQGLVHNVVMFIVFSLGPTFHSDILLILCLPVAPFLPSSCIQGKPSLMQWLSLHMTPLCLTVTKPDFFFFQLSPPFSYQVLLCWYSSLHNPSSYIHTVHPFDIMLSIYLYKVWKHIIYIRNTLLKQNKKICVIL